MEFGSTIGVIQWLFLLLLKSVASHLIQQSDQKITFLLSVASCHISVLIWQLKLAICYNYLSSLLVVDAMKTALSAWQVLQFVLLGDFPTRKYYITMLTAAH